MQMLCRNKKETLTTWLVELKEFELDNIFDTNILGRAFLYTDSVSIMSRSTNDIEAKIGNTTIYEVKLKSENAVILGNCSCPYDGKCKHLAALVLNQISIK